MEHLDIILPLVLLVLAFFLKLSIDRTIKAPNVIQAICELPVDMIFLSLSFLIAFTISNTSGTSKGLFFTLGFIVIAIIIVIIWRKSIKLYDSKNKLWVLLLCLNLLISTFSLLHSMDILLETTEITENKINNTNPDGNK
ncbi:hypothetical protein [Tenacibaculum aiptasiae]|uniref:hypothetical protein n=1 Tax=Tenacibaculum aiptasiae TaxID=426481 RepID=UPI003B5926EA